MFQQDQIKSLLIATGLILFNIGLMWVFAFTPLSKINDLLFGTFFLLGVIVYGAMLSIGIWLAKKGFKEGNKSLAISGTGLTQLAYGIFGAGILSMALSPQIQGLALLITAIASGIIALGSGLLVFGTGHDFSNWGRYANYIFLGVLGISFIGSFTPVVIVIAFLLALIGFIVYLIHQIYMTKTRPGRPFMNALGLYAAFMGVFVEILQIVIRLLAKRE